MPDEPHDEQERAESLDEDNLGGDDLVEAGKFPPDKLSALTQIGPLIDERLAGEPVAERAMREQPEYGDDEDDDELGRLVAAPDDDPTDGVGESDVLADDSDDHTGLSAEEAANHLTQSP
jgi:hypothetical protein